MIEEISRSRLIQDSGPGSFALNFEPFPYLSIPAFQRTHLVTAAISTRIGGVSHPPYQSLDLAYHVGDVKTAVTENRRRFCKALGIDAESLVITQQVHGDKIAVIDENHAGCGAYNYEESIAGADGMITRSRFVSLAVLTADCVPVLILDPVKRVIGIAHAGWRSMLQMIAGKTILMMHDAFGTEAADCLAAIGPSIGLCCYTVGEDVIRQFQGNSGSEECITDGRIDLQSTARNQLQKAGVKESNISCQKLCTACKRDLFYSYRAEGGITGRMMSVIKLSYGN